MANDVT